MLLSITLEKMVGAGEPYFLEASSASLTSLFLEHSGLCWSEKEDETHTGGKVMLALQTQQLAVRSESNLWLVGGALQVPHRDLS